MIVDKDLDIVSSDFCYISELLIQNEYKDVITRVMNIYTDEIKKNLEERHNVIAHPSVCFSKRFWLDGNNRYDINMVPQEDLDLWIRSIKNGYKFGIHNNILLNYRIHQNQVSNK
jgi:hypothetical protein